jgi:hypothetical protein
VAAGRQLGDQVGQRLVVRVVSGFGAHNHDGVAR